MSRTSALLKKDNRTAKQRQSAFLDAFCDVANVTRAAKKSKVGRRTVYDWIDNDQEFATAFDAAVKLAIAALEDEAIRRAHEGTVKSVYQGGKKVGTVREYSDTLLIFLLKGLAPEKYKDRFQGELTGKGGSPIKTESEVHHTVDYDSLPDEVLQAIVNARVKPTV